MSTPDPFASVAALGISAPRAAPRPVAPTRPGVVPLPQAVRQWRDLSSSWLRVDDPDSAGNLVARKPSPELPRVVVVGETNRGKSSLINALLGVPGLSPVDAGTATCSYLVFTKAATPYTVARFGGGMADITFPPKDLRAWATVDGEPDVDIPPPRWIEVGVPCELTSQLTIVDTPGVGGLVAAHGELAAEAAAAAAALLFVVDASAPFTRGELDFLTAVSDRVEAVHFVVTKTDAYRGWREIVEADRHLLARWAPRFSDAPFHPVSSRLAEAAAAAADPKIAEVLLTQSGVGQLRTILQSEVAAVAAMMSDANIIRTSVTVLSGAVLRLEGRRRALTAGAAQAEALKARREELLGQRKAGTRGWQVMLRAEIQRARVDLTHETAREVREASQMFRGSIDQADNAELKNMAFHIDAYAQAMTARAHGRLIEAMGRICRTVLSELFSPEEMTLLVGQLATRPYSGLTTRAPEKARNLDDTIMTMSGAGMGFTLSRMVTMLPAAALPAAFGVVMAPVSIVLGGAAAFYLMRSRRRMADKQHLKQWLMEVLGEAKAQIDQNIAEQFIEADEQLTLALDDVLVRQVAALDNEIREVDGALKLDATERAGQLRALDERRGAGATIIGGGEALLQRIRATRVGGLPPLEISSVAAGLAAAMVKPALSPRLPAELLPSPAALRRPIAPAPAIAPPPATAPPPPPSIRLPAGLPQLVAETQRASGPPDFGWTPGAAASWPPAVGAPGSATPPADIPPGSATPPAVSAPASPGSSFAGLNLSALSVAAENLAAQKLAAQQSDPAERVDPPA
ncbi:hypothetical protein ABIB25_002648 [Nakamurella sp. UYEF19]|uniref:dynamin family protein n=1 Tax=Nakamurella sp. UYEF19 TaxID=1756392 RepID=UPI003396029A